MLEVDAPMKEVTGKVAFITGGTSGIGFGIAQAFVRAGMKAVIAGTSRERIAKALEHFAATGHANSVHAIRVNVTDRPGMQRAAAEAIHVFGKIHVLVNNAGVVIPATLSQTSYENWDWLMNVNLTGAFNGVHVFLPHIQAHGEGGQIMSTSSILGLFVTDSGRAAAYSASKFALMGMMEALRAELAGSRIGASVICPGVVNSRLEESSLRDISGDAAAAGLDAELMERTKRVREDPNLAMDPLEMGELVLRGMRNNDLYILTHPEFEQILRDRSEALLASILRDPSPSAERLEMAQGITQKSIYAAVRRIQPCSHAPRRTHEHGNPLREFAYGQIDFESGVHQSQLEQTHAVLMSLDEDSLLKPFRACAGLDAPGIELGGWYSSGGYVPGHTFGQWLSGLSRYHAISGDAATRAKVHRLVDAFARTVEPGGKFYKEYRHRAYVYDLLACGLIDAHRLTHQPNALPALTAATQAVMQYLPGHATEMRLDRKCGPDEHCIDHNYVIPENQFLAWQHGGDEVHLRMARQYLLDEFFDPLAKGENALPGRHAYTHVNALCSAAKAYLVLGDEKYLQAAKNGFAFLDAQSYATGAWGPAEYLLPSPGYPTMQAPQVGSLGKSLEITPRCFETPCGAYAHMKLTRYLLRITRDARYGDSLERILYNTVLGAKPLQPDGHAFYYSDYGAGARKGYLADYLSDGMGPEMARWPCCSGTLPQAAADYRIGAYCHDEEGVYVNLYIPSTLQWSQRGVPCVLKQWGAYPLDDLVTLELDIPHPMEFALRLRIPAWAKNPAISVNGKRMTASVQPSAFATLTREWKSGDRIELELPRSCELKPIDGGHPDRVALCCGPLVLFAIGEQADKLDRQALLAARQTMPASPEWRSGALRFLPWWMIRDEHYTTYHDVRGSK